MLSKGLYYELVSAQSDNEKSKTNEKEDELDEELAKQIQEEMKTRNRSTSIAARRQSIISVKSVTSDFDEKQFNLNDNNQDKKSFFHLPFIFKIAKLNTPEWYYLLLGGIASLLFGCVMPVRIDLIWFFLNSYLFLLKAFALIFSDVFGVLGEPDLQKKEDQIRTYTYSIFLVGVGGAICQMVSSSTLTKSGEELTLRMRSISFRSMLKQEIGWFDLDENNLGALVTRLSSDAAALKGLTGQTLGAILNAVGALVFALVISFISGWKLTLVLLSFAPLMIFTGTVQGKQNAKKVGITGSATSDSEDGGKVCF